VRLIRPVNNSKQSEAGIVARARAGDRQASVEIVHLYYEKVNCFLAHLTQDPELAADLTQDVFATVWVKIKTFRGNSSLGTWLNRIAYFRYIDAGRAMTRRKRGQLELQRLAQKSGSISPLVVAIEKESTQLLYAAVQQLPNDLRVVIVLHYFQGLSMSETAEVVARPTGTVKWLNRKALNELRGLLSKDCPKEQINE